jgi:hypothetical protein
MLIHQKYSNHFAASSFLSDCLVELILIEESIFFTCSVLSIFSILSSEDFLF